MSRRVAVLIGAGSSLVRQMAAALSPPADPWRGFNPTPPLIIRTHLRPEDLTDQGDTDR